MPSSYSNPRPSLYPGSPFYPSSNAYSHHHDQCRHSGYPATSPGSIPHARSGYMPTDPSMHYDPSVYRAADPSLRYDRASYRSTEPPLPYEQSVYMPPSPSSPYGPSSYGPFSLYGQSVHGPPSLYGPSGHGPPPDQLQSSEDSIESHFPEDAAAHQSLSYIDSDQIPEGEGPLYVLSGHVTNDSPYNPPPFSPGHQSSHSPTHAHRRRSLRIQALEQSAAERIPMGNTYLLITD